MYIYIYVYCCIYTIYIPSAVYRLYIYILMYIYIRMDTDDYPFCIIILDLYYWAAYQTSPLRCLRNTSTKKPKLNPLLLPTPCPTPNMIFQMHTQTWWMVTPFYPHTQARDQRIFLDLSLSPSVHIQYNNKFYDFALKIFLTLSPSLYPSYH